LSMADGHAEYWKWSDETRTIPRTEMPALNGFTWRGLGDASVWHEYAPETKDGRNDLHRMQRAVWGRLGYNPSRRRRGL